MCDFLSGAVVWQVLMGLLLTVVGGLQGGRGVQGRKWSGNF